MYTNRETMEVQEHYAETELFRAMRPIFISLKIWGMFYTNETKNDNPETSTRRYSPAKVYAYVVLLFLWLTSLRFLATAFGEDDTFGPWLFLKVLCLTWTLSCTVNVTTCIYACQNDECLSAFFRNWKLLHFTSRANCTKYITRRIPIYWAIAWVAIFLNVVSVVYSLFFTPVLDIMITPLKASSSYALYAKMSYCVVHLYLSAAWSLPPAVAFMFCVSLYREFTLVNRQCRRDIGPGGAFPRDLMEHRLRHEMVIQMMGNVDNFLRIYIANAYLTSMISLCMLIYNIIYYTEIMQDWVVMAMHIFWVATFIVNLGVASWAAAMVNDAAHDLFDELHRIRASDVNHAQSLQMTMFLNRLSGPTIGLTAGGVFVIDKPTILTIVGMLITYFVLVVQFSPTSTSSTCDCTQDCKEVLNNYTLHCMTSN